MLSGDHHTPAGVPFEGDPRYILRRTLAKAAELGYSMNVGPECHSFAQDGRGRPAIMSAQDSAGYFDLGPADLGENARRDMCLAGSSRWASKSRRRTTECEGRHRSTSGTATR